MVSLWQFLVASMLHKPGALSSPGWAVGLGLNGSDPGGVLARAILGLGVKILQQKSGGVDGVWGRPGASCHGSDCGEAKSCMIGTAPGVERQKLFQGSEQVPQQCPRSRPASLVHSALSHRLYKPCCSFP